MSQFKQTANARVRLLKVFNSKQPGHVEDFDITLAKKLVESGMAEEAPGAELTPHLRKTWAGDRPGDEHVASLAEKDAEIEKLRAELADKPKRGRPAKETVEHVAA